MAASTPRRGILDGVMVCTAGFSPEEKARIAELVEKLGGTSHSALMETTTHLVTEAVGSLKYFAAAERGVSIVTRSWLEECEAMDTAGDLSRAPEKDHALPPLAGQELCLTGFADDEKRHEIEACIERGGAMLSRSLRRNDTTHLIAGTPAGEKFEAAMRWGIPVVRPTWLFECLAQKRMVNPASYAFVGAGPNAALAARDSSSSSSHRLRDVTSSAPPQAHLAGTVRTDGRSAKRPPKPLPAAPPQLRTAAVMVAEADAVRKFETIGEAETNDVAVAATLTKPFLFNARARRAFLARGLDNNSSEDDNSGRRRRRGSSGGSASSSSEEETPSHVRVRAKRARVERVDSDAGSNHAEDSAAMLLRAEASCSLCMSGCVLFIAGFEAEEYRVLVALARMGGATRLQVASSGITHVVVSCSVPRELAQALSQLSPAPLLVRPSFVVACIQEARLVDATEHCVRLSELRSEKGTAVTRAVRGPTDTMDALSEETGVGIDASGPVLRRTKSSPGVVRSTARHVRAARPAASPGVADDTMPGGLDTAEQGDGLRISVFCCSKSRYTLKRLKRIAEELDVSPRWITTPPKPYELEYLVRTQDVIVVGHGESIVRDDPSLSSARDRTERRLTTTSSASAGVAAFAKGDRNVAGNGGSTDKWIRPRGADGRDLGCLVLSLEWWVASGRARKLLEPSTSAVYRPMGWELPFKGMKAVTLSVSRYSNEERANVKLLASALGATVAQSVGSDTTVLVCKDVPARDEVDGSKFGYCQERGIPVVTSAWLDACAAAGRMVSKEPFLLQAEGREGASERTPRTEMGAGRSVDDEPVLVDAPTARDEETTRSDGMERGGNVVEHEPAAETKRRVSPASGGATPTIDGSELLALSAKLQQRGAGARAVPSASRARKRRAAARAAQPMPCRSLRKGIVSRARTLGGPTTPIEHAGGGRTPAAQSSTEQRERSTRAGTRAARAREQVATASARNDEADEDALATGEVGSGQSAAGPGASLGYGGMSQIIGFNSVDA